MNRKPLDLEPIKETLEAYSELKMPPHAHMQEMADAIAALVAEVERLRGTKRPYGGVTITMHDQPPIHAIPVPRACRHCGRNA